MTLETNSVQRQLRANWTMEAELDLHAYLNHEIEQELINDLAEEINREIDREIVRQIVYTTPHGHVFRIDEVFSSYNYLTTEDVDWAIEGF